MIRFVAIRWNQPFGRLRFCRAAVAHPDDKRLPVMSLTHRHLKGFTPGPKAVGSFVPKLAQKAFEKFGFATAAILTDWQSIVGPELAAMTAPERLRWPRQPEGDGGPAESKTISKTPARAKPTPRSGATLILRVDPSRALDVQYKTMQIVERINAYFGYLAVTDLRLIQAPLEVARPAHALSRKPAVSPKAVLKSTLKRNEADGIEDADLRQALERLGSAITAAPHRHG
jgi:hypothetical protein